LGVLYADLVGADQAPHTPGGLLGRPNILTLSFLFLLLFFVFSVLFFFLRLLKADSF
jgi:hypothetical protein